MPSILLVQDDQLLRMKLRRVLEMRGHAISEARSIAQARPSVASGIIDIAIIDVRLPDGCGFDLLDIARTGSSPPVVIMVGGDDDLGLTITAIRRGASDCLPRSLDLLELETAIANAMDQRVAELHARYRNDSGLGTNDLPNLVGKSAPMRLLAKRVAQAAATDEPVLLTGESGTGKEVVARTIHFSSARASRPFVAVNCAALTSSLVESELFGSSRGSFTGSVADRQGRFESAADGTLFLDEIGELALDMQPKLLRVLQERTFERVGDTQISRLDARVIAATNRDLTAEVCAGRFRADLYYRLDVLSIGLPALRERIGDIELLTTRLLAAIAGERRRPHHIDGAAMARLRAHDWPGNVRELGNILRRAVAAAPRGAITESVIDAVMVRPRTSNGVPRIEESDTPLATLAAVEHQHIQRTLERCVWHKRQACRILGISRPTLDRKIREYGLQRPGNMASDDSLEIELGEPELVAIDPTA